MGYIFTDPVTITVRVEKSTVSKIKKSVKNGDYRSIADYVRDSLEKSVAEDVN